MPFRWVLIELKKFDFQVRQLDFVGQPADTVAVGRQLFPVRLPTAPREFRLLDMPLLYKLLQYERECTFWIRGSTGRLCTDLAQSNNLSQLFSDPRDIPSMQELFPLGSPNTEAIVIDCLTLEQYHRITYWNLGHRRTLSTSASIIANLGAILSWSSSNRLEDAVEISSTSPKNQWGDWVTIQGMKGGLTEDGWTRY